MSLFDFLFGSKTDPKTDTIVNPYGKRPVVGTTKYTDDTGGMAANTQQMSDIYHGRDNRYNLAQDLIYTPISRSVQLIGIPIPIADNDPATQEAADRIRMQFSDEFGVIEQSKLLSGTSWRYPKWDAKNNKIALESIKDDSITMMDIDLLSGEINGLWTDDTFIIPLSDTTTTEVRRKRHITRQRIDITWTGDTKGLYKDTSQFNRFGILPIPFGHDCDDGEWRGTGLLMQNFRLLKSYHEINRNECQILAQFQPKWIQSGVENIDQWFENNGFDKSTALEQANSDAFSSRFQINGVGETTNYVFLPSDATSLFDAKLDKLRTAYIAASPIPEIFYGNLATGNESSVTVHKDLAIAYIDSLRKENKAPYEELYNDCLQILSFVENKQYGTVKVCYDALDMLSSEERSTIFSNVMTGAGKLVQSIGGSTQDMFYFLKSFYPDLPEKTYEEFYKNLDTTIDLHARSMIDAATLADMNTAK